MTRMGNELENYWTSTVMEVPKKASSPLKAVVA